jgi:hypothetical protein
VCAINARVTMLLQRVVVDEDVNYPNGVSVAPQPAFETVTVCAVSSPSGRPVALHRTSTLTRRSLRLRFFSRTLTMPLTPRTRKEPPNPPLLQPLPPLPLRRPHAASADHDSRPPPLSSRACRAAVPRLALAEGEKGL